MVLSVPVCQSWTDGMTNKWMTDTHQCTFVVSFCWHCIIQKHCIYQFRFSTHWNTIPKDFSLSIKASNRPPFLFSVVALLSRFGNNLSLDRSVECERPFVRNRFSVWANDKLFARDRISRRKNTARRIWTRTNLTNVQCAVNKQLMRDGETIWVNERNIVHFCRTIFIGVVGAILYIFSHCSKYSRILLIMIHERQHIWHEGIECSFFNSTSEQNKKRYSRMVCAPSVDKTKDIKALSKWKTIIM